MNRAARLAPLVVAALLGLRALARRGRRRAQGALDPVMVSAPARPAGPDRFPSRPEGPGVPESRPVAAGPPSATPDPPPVAAEPRPARADPPPARADPPPAIPDPPPALAAKPPAIEVAARRRAPSRRPAVLSLSFAALRWTALGVAIGLVGALAGAKGLGYETMTVMSGSMEPRIHTGDVVVAKPMAPPDARVGDVITFQEPHGEGRLITHRVRSMRVQAGKVRFVTKGDANNTTERWQIPVDGNIARVTNRGWRIGYLLAFLRDPQKRLWLISIPAVLLGLYELVRIWRPRPAAQPACENTP